LFYKNPIKIHKKVFLSNCESNSSERALKNKQVENALPINNPFFAFCKRNVNVIMKLFSPLLVVENDLKFANKSGGSARMKTK
jgi:hypothetical protein